MARASLLWTAVLATAVSVAACSGEREGRGDEDEGLGGPTSVTTTPVSTPAPAATPTPEPAATPTPAPGGGTTVTAVAFDQDIAPILRSDCTRCHSSFGSYAGAMAFVQPGSAGSPLVTATQPGGSMYSYLSGDRAAKADSIRRWVVDNRALQSR
jgi:hypothetical protein